MAFTRSKILSERGWKRKKSDLNSVLTKHWKGGLQIEFS